MTRLTGRRYNKQFVEDLTDELTFFKYLTREKLRYICREDKSYSREPVNNRNYPHGNREEQPRRHGNYNSYPANNVPHREPAKAGEFGVIMASKLRQRGRPSNVFKKLDNKPGDQERYQQLSFEEVPRNAHPNAHYNYNFHNQRINPEHDEYYARSEYNYTPVDYEVQNDFQRTYDSWSNLYRSMSNTVNHNENLYENYEQEPVYANDKGHYNSGYNNNEPVCAHCSATETSLWRRLDGKTVCNACGLYFKMHGVKRPITLKKYSIKKRRRTGKRNNRSE